MRIIISADKGNFADIRSAAGAEETIDWWDDANPASAVCTTCFAAVELYEHLLQLPAIAGRTDNEVVLTESAEGDSGDWLLLVGGASANPATAALEQRLGRVVSAGVDAPEESYRVCTVMHEGMRYTVLSGRDRTGTLYAAYALLEKLGIRWYAPDECGTVFPPAEAPFFPEEGDETSAPAYTTRGIYTEFADDADERLIAWAARNRCNYALFHRIDRPHRLKKRGIRLGGGGHNLLHRFMNPKAPHPYRADGAVGEGDSTTAEAHPEWFALIGGQRSFRTGNNPEVEGYYWGDNYCTSNSEATEELCSRVVDDLIGGAWSRLDYLDVWLYDNGVWCECEECAAQGNYTRRMALLVHELSGHIAKAIAAGRLKRNVKLIFAAYHECLDAPDRPLPDDFDYSRCLVTFFPIERCYVHDFADPCCTETNAKLVRQYESWTKGEERTYRGELFIGEYYNVSSFANMPLLFGDRIAADIPYYYETGARHFYYMHIPVKRW
ncbi:MAG: DUF4838 domain-containing protein, partial [Paenibacillaceae bacterium]|nr:DUF4838 domain-containing protein [Paenibacillaceae bacterium]